jgi:nitrogen fixation NifU-like protein
LSAAPGYSPQLRDHLDHPRSYGRIEDADGVGHDENPVCGDVMTVWIRVRDGVIDQAGFEVKGCEPSIAAGSAAMDLINGGAITRAKGLTADEVDTGLGGLPPVKRHCSLLAARAVRDAVEDFERETT